MFIPRHYAQSIVTKIHSLINQDLAFIDTDGIILVSTEKHRNGSYHPIAHKLVQDNLMELAIYEDDPEKGIKNGLHTAIHFENKVVGVIGITGNPNEIRIFNRIVQAFTELIIRDLYKQEQLNIESRAQYSFIEEWLFHPVSDPDAFIMRGNILRIDVLLPRTIVIVHVEKKRNKSPDSPAIVDYNYLNYQIIGYIKSSYAVGPNDLMATADQNIILLIETKAELKMKDRISSLIADIEAYFGVACLGGVGSAYQDFKDIYSHYKNALSAITIAQKHPTEKVVVYDDMPVALLIGSIPKIHRDNYVRRIFADANAAKLAEIFNTLEVYFSNNGSINQAATEMFIHKNTLQYRLSKITEQTGYDPRNFMDAFLLYLAMLSHTDDV